PESPMWQQKKQAGTLKRPSFAALFSPKLRTTTLVTTVMVACSYGAAFGAIQQMPQIAPGFPHVKAEVAPVIEKNREKLEALPDDAARAKARRGMAAPISNRHAGQITLWQEIGGPPPPLLLPPPPPPLFHPPPP